MQVQTMVAPVMKEPDENAEMVTQVLLGNQVKLILNKGCWSYIAINQQKNYQGWIKSGYLRPISPHPHSTNVKIFKLFASIKARPDHTAETVEEGIFLASLKVLEESFDWLFVESSFNRKGWIYKKDITSSQQHCLKDKTSIISIAKQFIGTPYLWGGITPYGIDCSGFVYTVFASQGIYLYRDSHLQYYHNGFRVERNNLQSADLIFFNTLDKDENTVSHVGIYVNESIFIHASSNKGKVVFDNLQENDWPNHYYGAKRIVSSL